MLDWIRDFAIEILALLRCWEVIHPYERGIVMRLGKMHRVIDTGFHWKIPFHVETVHCDSVVWRTTSLPSQSVTTSDGHAVHVRAVVTARIKDVEKAWLEVEHVDHALRDSCAGEIGRVIAETAWEDLWHGKANDALSKACRARGFKWGLEIDRVQLSDIARGRVLRVLTR